VGGECENRLKGGDSRPTGQTAEPETCRRIMVVMMVVVAMLKNLVPTGTTFFPGGTHNTTCEWNITAQVHTS